MHSRERSTIQRAIYFIQMLIPVYGANHPAWHDGINLFQ
jgi:hypothetical protein